MLNNLAKREKILIIIGAVLIVAYGYYAIFFGPALTQIKEEKSAIEIKNKQYEDILKLKASNATNKTKLEAAKKKYDEAVTKLPTSVRDPQISNDLNVLATKNNLTMASIGFGNDTDYVEKVSGNKTGAATTASTTTQATTQKTASSNQKLKFVAVNLVLNGDGNQVIKFIKNVEEDTRIAEVENVNITAKSETKNIVQASMTINYYYNYNPTNTDKPNYDDLIKGSSGKDSLFN